MHVNMPCRSAGGTELDWSLSLFASKPLPGNGRKLYELTITMRPLSPRRASKQSAALYRIEGQARGQSAEERLATRQQKPATKIPTFKIWLDHARMQLSAKSPTGQALKYIAKL